MIVNIRSSNADRAEVELESPDVTVSDLMSAIEQKTGIEKERQKLIFKGRVMNKEGNTLESYGITDGDTVHMVKSAAASPSGPSSGSTATSSASASASAPAPAAAPVPGAMPGMGIGFGGGMGGQPG